MTDGAAIGRALQQWRWQRGESIETVARRAQVTPEALCALEAGHDANPTIGLMRDVARALDYPIDTLVHDWLTNV